MNHLTTAEKLRAKKNELDFTLYTLRSVCDEDFLIAMRIHPKVQSFRDCVPSIAVREDNITRHRLTGCYNTSSKEMFLLIKNGSNVDMLEHLYSLDDASLLQAMCNDIVKAFVVSSMPLTARCQALNVL